MDDRYITRSRILLAAMIGVGSLLCACWSPPNLPQIPAGQRMRHSPAPDSGHPPVAPESPNTDDDSTARMASLAAVGGTLLLQQQGERGENCPGDSCEGNPVPFLKLETM